MEELEVELEYAWLIIDMYRARLIRNKAVMEVAVDALRHGEEALQAHKKVCPLLRGE